MIKVFRILGTAAHYLPSILFDAAGVAGAVMVAYGAHMIYEPAGYIVGGAILLAGAWLGNRRAP